MGPPSTFLCFCSKAHDYLLHLSVGYTAIVFFSEITHTGPSIFSAQVHGRELDQDYAGAFQVHHTRGLPPLSTVHPPVDTEASRGTPKIAVALFQGYVLFRMTALRGSLCKTLKSSTCDGANNRFVLLLTRRNPLWDRSELAVHRSWMLGSLQCALNVNQPTVAITQNRGMAGCLLV